MSRAAPCTSLEVFRHVTSAELTNIVGYPTIGIIFDTALFGTALAQMLYYMSNYPKDPLWLKGLVAAIWSADVLKEITCVMMLWSLLVRHHADPVALASVPTPYIIEQIVDDVESSAVQCYYIYISWKVGTHKWWNRLLFIIAIPMSITSVACVSAAMYYLDIEDTSALASLGKVTIATNVISLITDLYITISLCIIFQSAKMPTQPSIIQSTSGRSESILSKLTRYTANRGIILCLHQALLLGTYIWDYKTGTQATEMFSFSRGALYFNAFLAVLNARHYLNASTSDTARYSSHNI